MGTTNSFVNTETIFWRGWGILRNAGRNVHLVNNLIIMDILLAGILDEFVFDEKEIVTGSVKTQHFDYFEYEYMQVYRPQYWQ